MSDGKRYTIKTVADFFSVPAARRALMLSEMVVWMDAHQQMRDALGDIVAFPPQDFVWIDDDKGEAHVKVKAGRKVIAQGIVTLGSIADD